MSTTAHTYGSNRQCRGCPRKGPQVWVATQPGPEEGLCYECRKIQPMPATTKSIPAPAPANDTVPPPADVPPPAPSSALAVVAPAPLAPVAPAVVSVLDAKARAIEAQTSAVLAFTIATTAHRDAIAAALPQIKAQVKALDAEEKTITRPQLASLEAARAVFRPLKRAYEGLEAAVKGKLRDYEIARAETQDRALAEAHAQAAAGNTDAAVAALATVTENTAAPGAQVRRPWVFEVKAVDLLPPEFVMANEDAIREEMRRQLAIAPDCVPIVPGVVFKRDVQIAAGRS